jgi:glucose-6-phosphate isomerase
MTGGSKISGKDPYLSLGEYEAFVQTALTALEADKVMERIWSHDHRVWKEEPDEITNRLGWLHSPESMIQAVPEISAFVEKVRSAGYSHALLLGMGGSSLAPEMFRRIYGVKSGYLDLAVLDSTDPGAVLAFARRLDPAQTLYIVSTKSGGTVETLSFMKYFYQQASKALGPDSVGAHFVAITDPGSRLESMSRELGFRKAFLNDPHIGGRYSALSYFGLVPAGLIGADLDALLHRGAAMARRCEAPCAENPGAVLGAVIGALANMGRDKLTLLPSPPIAPFGAWVEQLLAESTGKEGKGILPVDGEMLLAPEAYGRDRLFVHMGVKDDRSPRDQIRAIEEAGQPVVMRFLVDPYDIGAEIFLWEMATAVAGCVLGINPFDQPNVESAKVSARGMVAAFQKEGTLPEGAPTLESDGIRLYSDYFAGSLKEAMDRFLSRAHQGAQGVKGGSYVALQAYVPPNGETDAALKDLRSRIQTKCRLATTLGYGPRFLHSTGQLHKGDAGKGLFIQITAESPEDAPIPDEMGAATSSISFGILKMAQALGDGKALSDAGRPVIRCHIQGEVPEGLRKITEAIE